MDEEARYLLPLKNVVVFPGTFISFQLSDSDLISCMLSSWKVVLAPYEGDSVNDIGCLCEVVQVNRLKDGTLFTLRGLHRVKLEVEGLEDNGCYSLKDMEILEEREDVSPAREQELKLKLLDLLWRYDPNLADILEKILPIFPLSRLTDQIAFISPLKPEDKITLLKELDVELRAELLIKLMRDFLKHWPFRHYEISSPKVTGDRWVRVSLN